MRTASLDSTKLTPASHEDPAHPGVMKQVLFDSTQLASDMMMLNWAVIEPGNCFQPHYHEQLEEVFYILSGSGELIARMPDSSTVHRQSVGPSVALLIEPGEIHQMCNTGSEPLVYLACGTQLNPGGETVVVSQVALADN